MDRGIKFTIKKNLSQPGTMGLVNKYLHTNKTSSKMGTASYKAVKFLRKILPR